MELFFSAFVYIPVASPQSKWYFRVGTAQEAS